MNLVPNNGPDITSRRIYFSRRRGEKLYNWIKFNKLDKQASDIETDQRIFIPSSIIIFFPIRNQYFKKLVSKVNDEFLTFQQLIRAIYEVGVEAFQWDLDNLEDSKEKFLRLKSKKYLSKYKIQSGELFITGNCIYVNLST